MIGNQSVDESLYKTYPLFSED